MAEAIDADHMSDEDALMWNIEKDPVLRSTVVATALLDQRPDWDRLVRKIEAASRRVPRMRHRVVAPPFRLGPPRWVVDHDFDLDFHLRRFELPKPSNHAALLRAIEPILVDGFDRARPLWEMTLFEGLEGDRAALIVKFHHAMTDGVGGMQLAASLVDFSRDADHNTELPETPLEEAISRFSLVGDAFVHGTRRWQALARRIPEVSLVGARHMVTNPVQASKDAVHMSQSIAKMLRPATSPFSTIMTKRSLTRRVATLEIPTADLKAAAKRHGGTLNDAFVAAVLGGLKEYHDRRGASCEQLRMTMPINLRSSEAAGTGGNHWTPARFIVPLDILDVKERMSKVRQLVLSERSEPALGLTGPLAGMLNRLPTSTVTAIFGGLLKGVDFITSNVPGAPIPVFLAGAEMTQMFAFAPPAGAGVNVTLVSHNETCCIGVVADGAALPDLDLFMDCLRQGIAEVTSTGVPDAPTAATTGATTAKKRRPSTTSKKALPSTPRALGT
ncbi:MAG: wax ester/triacylglycerol synthase family O-acyltransferase [Acidimicrobiia bacterium]